MSVQCVYLQAFCYKEDRAETLLGLGLQGGQANSLGVRERRTINMLCGCKFPAVHPYSLGRTHSQFWPNGSKPEQWAVFEQIPSMGFGQEGRRRLPLRRALFSSAQDPGGRPEAPRGRGRNSGDPNTTCGMSKGEALISIWFVFLVYFTCCQWT